MTYNWHAKNYGKDFIYSNRLKCFDKSNIDPLKNSNMFAYYQAANLGVILQ